MNIRPYADSIPHPLCNSLVDYEPTANWGNWQYVAGVGNDPRASRQFNPIKQARDYDPHGDYVRTWIVQLKEIPSAKVHTPWLLTDAEWNTYLAKSMEELAKDTKRPEILPPSTLKGNARQALSAEAVGRLGLADHTRRKGQNSPYQKSAAAQSGSDGDVPNSGYLRTAGSSRSSLSISGSGTGSGTGSGSTNDQEGPLRHEGYASESTAASSYTSSEVGGGDGSECNTTTTTHKPQDKEKKPTSSSVNARPPSNRSRSSGTTVSESDGGSGNSSSNAKELNENKSTHPSASALNQHLREKDDFLSDTPYPRTPLFEQESWKPHYNRKDYGRKRNGPGGGNSRRLIRAPPSSSGKK